MPYSTEGTGSYSHQLCPEPRLNVLQLALNLDLKYTVVNYNAVSGVVFRVVHFKILKLSIS